MKVALNLGARRVFSVFARESHALAGEMSVIIIPPKKN